MSEAACWALVLGAGALVIVLFLIVWQAGKLTPDSRPNDWDQSLAAQYWQQEADKIRDYGLDKLRTTGKAWAASIATFLGVLSTVAFVSGPDDLVKDVGGDEAIIAAALILGAAGIAAIALLLATLAEQGTPKHSNELDGWTLKSLTEKRARQAADQIRWSRYLVLVALMMVIGATGIAWLTPLTGKEEAAKAQQAITSGPSGVACGSLSPPANSLTLTVAGGTPEPIEADAHLTLVEKCP
jgi:hypothetical protein